MADDVAVISSLVSSLRSAEAEAEAETFDIDCAVQEWGNALQKHNELHAHRRTKPATPLPFTKAKFRRGVKPARPRTLPKMPIQRSPPSAAFAKDSDDDVFGTRMNADGHGGGDVGVAPSTVRRIDVSHNSKEKDKRLEEFIVQYETKVKHMGAWSLPRVSSLTGSLKKVIQQLPRPTSAEMRRIHALEQTTADNRAVRKLYKSLALQPGLSPREFSVSQHSPPCSRGRLRSENANQRGGGLDEPGTSASRPGTVTSMQHTSRAASRENANDVAGSAAVGDEDEDADTANDVEQLPKDFISQFKDRVYDELGLDLDAEHTYRRLYGTAARTLLSAMSGGSLRRAWRQWRNVVQSVIYVEQSEAAKRIQTRIRSYLARREATRRRQLLRNQQEHLRMLRERQNARRTAAAKAITAALWRYVSTKKRRRVQRRIAAAVTIQRVFRGVVTRRWVYSLWEWKTWHATVIQTWIRRWQAIRRVKLMRKLHAVETLARIVENRISRRQATYQQQGAAMLIQRFYRCKRFRKRLRLYVRINHEMYANMIQNVVRGYLVRRSTSRLLQQRRLERMKRIAAATVLQALVRMYLAKCHLRRLQRQAELRDKRRVDYKRRRLRQHVIRTQSGRTLVDVDAVKRHTRTFVSNLHPLRNQINRRSAVTIQKVYRGHRARRRTESMRLRRYIQRSLMERRRQAAAATTIQACWRGHQVRLHIFGKRHAARIVQVQASARLMLTLKRVRRMKEENHAAAIIQRHWRGIFVRRRFAALLARHKECLPRAIKIQTVVRRFLAKSATQRLLCSRRKEAEEARAVSASFVPMLLATYREMIEDTISTPLAAQHVRAAGRKRLGPVQALFLAWCSKDKLRMDQQEFGKALHACFRARKSATRNVQPHSWHGYDQDLLDWLGLDQPVRVSHVDLIYSKVKRSKAHGLSFIEFVKALALVRQHQTQMRPGTTTTERSTAPSTSFQESSSDNSGEGDESESEDEDQLRLDAAEQQEAARVALWVLLRQDSALLHLAGLHTPTQRKPSQLWMQTAHDSIVALALERLGATVTPVQSVVRSYLARKVALQRKLLRQERLLQVRKAQAAYQLQRYFLWVRAVCTIRRRAEEVFEKYTDLATRRTYWYNPRTRARSWAKPRILGSGDCREIPLPAEKDEFVTACGNCDAAAEVSCQGCCESFCQTCYDNIHVKGARQSHQPERIMYCSHCNFQMASKHCRTCSRYHRKGFSQNYCDTCFAFLHHPSAVRLHEARLKETRKSTDSATSAWTVNAILSTKEVRADPFAIAAVTQGGVLTSHQTEHLAAVCEECGNKAARWKCHDCVQIYCELCLVALHSTGPFRAHTSDKLSYLTPKMYRRSKQLTSDAVARVRLQQVLQNLQQESEAQQFAAAIKIQKIYRGWRGRLVGKAILKAERQQLRESYRQRKMQSETTSTAWYRFLLFFGWAPRLPGDTIEDAVLKTVSALSRARAMRYIYQNKQDLLWYPPPNSDPLTLAGRAVAKRGFEVGSYEELCAQAKWKGVRLPGEVAVKYGACVMATSKDLSHIIADGDLVRLQGMTLFVSKVTDSSIEFNSYWRQPSCVQGVLYLIDRRDWIIRSMYSIKRNVLLSSTFQKIVELNIYIQHNLEKRALRMSRFFKSSGRPDVARGWKRKAKQAVQAAKHWEMLLFDNQPEEKARQAAAAAHEEAVKAAVEEEAVELTEEELLKEAEAWVEEYDMTRECACYRNTVTGEVALQPPAAVKARWRAKEEAELARKAHEETRARIASMRKK